MKLLPALCYQDRSLSDSIPAFIHADTECLQIAQDRDTRNLN